MAESALAPTTAPAQDALPGEHNEAGAQEPEPPSDAPEEKPAEPEAFLTRAQQDSKFPTSRKGRKGGKQKASAKPKGKAKSSARPKAKAGTKPKAKASPKPKATPKPKAQRRSVTELLRLRGPLLKRLHPMRRPAGDQGLRGNARWTKAGFTAR